MVEPFQRIVKYLHQHHFDHRSMGHDEEIVKTVPVDAFHEGRNADKHIQRRLSLRKTTEEFTPQ